MTSARADTYGVGFPAEWTPIPLDLDEHASFVRRTLQRLDERGIDTVGRRRAELLLRQSRQQLVDSDVRYAAVGITILPEADGLLVAGGAVVSSTRESLGSQQRLTASAVQRAVARALPTTADEAPVDIEAPSIVELPAGDAVRTRRYSRQRVEAGEVIELYTESYMLPHDDGERLCTLQFVTPNVEFSRSFARVFELSALTLRVFGEGDETTFDMAAGGAADD